MVESLYKRATGFEYNEVELKTDDKTKSKRVTKKLVAPDPTSAIFWLKNRQPKLWRDKQTIEQEQQEPTPVTIVVNAVDARKDDGNQSEA